MMEPSVQGQMMPDTAVSLDKPLPDPMASGILGKSQSTRHPSSGNRRRMSLSDGLVPHEHRYHQDQIPEGDRYPQFPGLNGPRGNHSRHSSYGSINPANYAFPA